MADEQKRPAEIRFDYIKTPDFRVSHADGIIGGVTPNGSLFMAFYHERQPIPQQITHQLKFEREDPPAATLGPEIPEKRVIRPAIIRETEAAVIMDYRTAKALQDWLQKQIPELEKVEAHQREDK